MKYVKSAAAFLSEVRVVDLNMKSGSQRAFTPEIPADPFRLLDQYYYIGFNFFLVSAVCIHTAKANQN